MARRDRNEGRERRPETPPQGGSFLSPAFLSAATLVGVVILIVLNASIFTKTSTLQEKVETFDNRLASLGKNVEAISKTAQAPRQQQGPDPNKVYTVKMQGSPAEGPENAVVTIAEFSDFQ